MEMLWQSNKLLTSVEMLERSDGSSWKDNYLHIMLRSLLKKGSIQVCGTVQYGTQYARQFEPALTKERVCSKTHCRQRSYRRLHNKSDCRPYKGNQSKRH